MAQYVFDNINVVNELTLGTNVFYVNNVTDLVNAIATGGKIVLAPGTYSLSATQNLVAGTQIIGSGANLTTITIDNALDLPAFVLADNVNIEDVTLDGNGSNQTSVTDFLSGTSVDNLVLRDVVVVNIINYTSICVFTDCNIIKILNSTFTAVGTSRDINFLATSLGNTSDVIIDNCIFNSTTNISTLSFNNTIGIKLSKLVLNNNGIVNITNGEKVNITDCQMGQGLNAGNNTSLLLTSITNIVVKGCIFEPATNVYAMAIGVCVNANIISNSFNNVNVACVRYFQCENIIIDSNTCINCENFVEIIQISALSTNDSLTVINNQFNGNGTSSVFVLSSIPAATALGSFRLTVDNNKMNSGVCLVEWVSTVASNFPVIFSINNNKCVNVELGCEASIPGTSNRLQVNNNEFYNIENGVKASGFFLIKVNNNSFEGAPTSCMEIGFLGSVNSVQVNNNTIEGFTGFAIGLGIISGAIEINNNTITGDSAGTGINFTNQLLNPTINILGNIIKSVVTGITIASVAVDKLMIGDNQIIGQGTSFGLNLNPISSNEIIIDNNIIKNFARSVSLISTSISTLIIESNTFRNSTTQIVNISRLFTGNSLITFNNNICDANSGSGVSIIRSSAVITGNIFSNTSSSAALILLRGSTTIPSIINNNNFISNFSDIDLNTSFGEKYDVQKNNTNITYNPVAATILTGGIFTISPVGDQQFRTFLNNSASVDTEVEVNDVIIGGSTASPLALLESVVSVYTPIISNSAIFFNKDYPLGTQETELRRADRITIDGYNDVVNINITNGLARVTIPDLSSYSAGHILKVNVIGTPPVSGTNYVCFVPTSYDNGTRLELDLSERTSVEFEWNGSAWKTKDNFSTTIVLSLNTAQLAEAQIITNFAIVPVIYKSLILSKGGFNMTSIASADAFTNYLIIPKTGWYKFNANVVWEPIDIGYQFLWISVNDNTDLQYGYNSSYRSISSTSVPGLQTNISITTINLNQGDSVKAYVLQNSGSARFLTTGTVGGPGGASSTGVIEFSCTFLGN